MKRLALLALGFAYMVLLIEALRATVNWWNAVPPPPTFLDYALIALLPVLAWIWWRYLSVFNCQRSCRVPDQEERKA